MTGLHPARSRWVRRAGIPERFLGSTLDGLSPYAMHAEVMSAARSWIGAVAAGEVVRSPGSPRCGLGLALVGPPGAGKSRLAATLLQELAACAGSDAWHCVTTPTMPIRYASYVDVLSAMQSGYDGEQEFAYLAERMFGACPAEDAIQVLVVDDLGKEHRSATGWSQGVFERLLRSRFDRGFPTIVTTNVHRDRWSDAYGESLDSFAHEALESLVILSPGGDRRR